MYSSIPKSLLEINKIEIIDKTLQLPKPSVTGNLRPSDKIRKNVSSITIFYRKPAIYKEIQL